MATVIETAPARAGLLGNPSDGYFGKTLSVSLANFRARVTLTPSETLGFEEPDGERETFADLSSFMRHVEREGYGEDGGARVMKAAVKRFADECRARGVELADRRFVAAFDTDVPRQVGLAGSSAIITATLRALVRWYDVAIPLERRPTIALEAETVELGIDAGLQDRVAQAYGGLVYMDFDAAIVESTGCGQYERLDPDLLPPLYVAYRPDLSKVSGAVLRPVRERYDRGDRHVIDTLARIAALAAEGRTALIDRDISRFGQLMNENFDLRRTILSISDGNLELVAAARACGASAKFAGSGGSIVGASEDDRMFAALEAALGALGATTAKAMIGEARGAQ